jgi:hypothetical protein
LHLAASPRGALQSRLQMIGHVSPCIALRYYFLTVYRTCGNQILRISGGI